MLTEIIDNTYNSAHENVNSLSMDFIKYAPHRQMFQITLLNDAICSASNVEASERGWKRNGYLTSL
jgi:hypothetical protein